MIQTSTISVFPKIGLPQNGWFIMENPFEMDDLGVPLFLDTSINVKCKTQIVFSIGDNTPLFVIFKWSIGSVGWWFGFQGSLSESYC